MAAVTAGTGDTQGRNIRHPDQPGFVARQDVGKILDDMQQRAGVTAVFPFMYTHGAARAGLPAAGFRGGNYAIPHMEYYKDTGLTYEDMRGTEFGDVDASVRLIPAVHKRDVKVFRWVIEDNRGPAIPHWEPLYEVDFHGRRAEGHPGGPRYNNPMYRAWLLGLVEDYSRSYEIDGIMPGWSDRARCSTRSARITTARRPIPDGSPASASSA